MFQTRDKRRLRLIREPLHFFRPTDLFLHWEPLYWMLEHPELFLLSSESPFERSSSRARKPEWRLTSSGPVLPVSRIHCLERAFHPEDTSPYSLPGEWPFVHQLRSLH